MCHNPGQRMFVRELGQQGAGAGYGECSRPSLSFYMGNKKINLNLCSIDILKILVVQRMWKFIEQILKCMWILTVHCFSIGTERLKHVALVTTLARQFWTRCNLVMSFSGICERGSYNYLICYWPGPLQFVWQELSTDFFVYFIVTQQDTFQLTCDVWKVLEKQWD